MMIALLNKKGLTLVEVLISLVVLLLVFLALMQTALVSIDSNMRDALRDEAVRIAEQRMAEARNLVFTETDCDLLSDSDPDDLVDADCPAGFSATGDLIERNFRNIEDFNFCTNRTVVEIGGDGNLATNDADDRQVNITVGWRWKDEDYTHNISTIIRKQ